MILDQCKDAQTYGSNYLIENCSKIWHTKFWLHLTRTSCYEWNFKAYQAPITGMKYVPNTVLVITSGCRTKSSQITYISDHNAIFPDIVFLQGDNWKQWNGNRKQKMKIENRNGQNLMQMNVRVKLLPHDHLLKTTSVQRPHSN